MFGIDEKTLADNRTLVTINKTKSDIDAILKNGTLNYSSNDNTLWLTTPKLRKAYVEKRDYIGQLDRILTAENGSLVKGGYSFQDDTKFNHDATIEHDLLVKGSLTVMGKSTCLDSPITVINDNIIMLNRNEKGEGITLKRSGTGICRGTKPFARYLYNEDMRCFVIDTNEDIKGPVDNWFVLAHTEDYDIYKAGDVRIRYRLITPNINVNSIIINNNAKINNLTVNGSSVFNNSATFNNPVTINENLTTLHVDINDSLTVKKSADVQGQLKANGLISSGTSTFSELTTFNKGIAISANGINSTGNLNVTGNALVTGTITSNDNAIFKKDINVTSSVISTNNNVSNKTTTKLLEVTSDAAIDNNLVIKGTATINNSVIINKDKTTINSLTDINKDVQILGSNLKITCNSNNENGSVFIYGGATINKNLIISGTSTLSGSVSTGELKSKKITSLSDFYTTNNDGVGYGFWYSNSYKIYMSSTSNKNLGGKITGSKDSDFNMYFKMGGGVNRGYVFLSYSTPIAQIESDGTFRTANNMYAKGSQVLRFANMGHAPTNEEAINACMVDGKHSTDILLRDGSQEMTGILQMLANPICWNRNSYFKYYASSKNEEGENYTGYYQFSSNFSIENTILKAGALNLDGLLLTGHNSSISKIKSLSGANGLFLSATDEWLRINQNSNYTSGVYFGSSKIRTDNELQVGPSGQIFSVNSTAMKYKDFNVLTTAGEFRMLGNINMGGTKLLFNNYSNGGTAGAGDTDNAAIYAEHDKDTQTSRLIIQMLDDADDNIQFRTGSNGNTKNSLTLGFGKAIFSDNPYFGPNRLLHTGNTGAGNGLDSDLLDGKHYSDLQTEFVKIAGDTMTGQLIMKKNIVLNSFSRLILNENPQNHLRCGETGYEKDVVLSAARDIYFYSNTANVAKITTNKTMYLGNSQVVTKDMYGHGKALDADTLDGKHYSDIDNAFIHKSGDTFTGDVKIQDLNPMIILNAVGTKSSPTSTAGIYYKNTNNQNMELVFTEYDSEIPEAGIGAIIRKTGNNISEKATLSVEGNIYSQNKRVITTNDEGHGKSFNADMLDNKHASEFAASTHTHDDRYVMKKEVNLNQKYQIAYNDSNNSIDFMYIG